ncbi:MAG: hypothetical protein M3384_22195 [Acidobacteriota bacterium]|nr:hypothetical protein [Acidobacteriota bacterium]
MKNSILSVETDKEYREREPDGHLADASGFRFFKPKLAYLGAAIVTRQIPEKVSQFFLENNLSRNLLLLLLHLPNRHPLRLYSDAQTKKNLKRLAAFRATRLLRLIKGDLFKFSCERDKGKQRSEDALQKFRNCRNSRMMEKGLMNYRIAPVPSVSMLLLLSSDGAKPKCCR